MFSGAKYLILIVLFELLHERSLIVIFLVYFQPFYIIYMIFCYQNLSGNTYSPNMYKYSSKKKILEDNIYCSHKNSPNNYHYIMHF